MQGGLLLLQGGELLGLLALLLQVDALRGARACVRACVRLIAIARLKMVVSCPYLFMVLLLQVHALCVRACARARVCACASACGVW